MTTPLRSPFALGPMPGSGRMRTVDEGLVRAPRDVIFALALDVERWPEHLAHYRYVGFHDRATDGGGIVEMSANRPFGPLPWPTWWTSEMSVERTGNGDGPSIRFRHVAGVTRGMDVEWSFETTAGGTWVRIVHVWNGPAWPVIGTMAAQRVIGPVFVHGIASRTLAGLARVAEARAQESHTSPRGT